MATLSLEDVLAAVENLRRDMQGQIDDLRAALVAVKTEAVAAASEAGQADAADEVSPEVLVMMAAVITRFLGKKVRVRSARLLPSAADTSSPWAQHSRVFVQAASHAMRRPR